MVPLGAFFLLLSEMSSSDGDGARDGESGGESSGEREDRDISLTIPPQPSGEEKLERVARYMFLGGCFFLPWVWILSIIYFWKMYRSDDCNENVKKYISLSIRGVAISTCILTIWVIIFQSSWVDANWARALLVFPVDNW